MSINLDSININVLLSNVFLSNIFYNHLMRGIKSKNHNLGIYETNKRSLSCFDDKRYILKNGINTLAYGHKDI